MSRKTYSRYERSQRRMLEFAAASGILAHSMGHSQEPISKQVKKARVAAKLLIAAYPDVGVSDNGRVKWKGPKIGAYTRGKPA